MENNIQYIAFELFRQWTKNAMFDYPELDFTIVDERILISDIENAIESALNNLLKTEKAKKRSLPGYEYGYVIGFIQGKINFHWGFEYITKRSKKFKSFLINKALLEFLQIESISAIKVQSIYEKIYDNTVNLESLEYDLPKKYITDYNLSQLEDENYSNVADNPVIIFLKNQNSELLIDLMKIETKEYLTGINDYFSDDFIRALIHNKESKEI